MKTLFFLLISTVCLAQDPYPQRASTLTVTDKIVFQKAKTGHGFAVGNWLTVDSNGVVVKGSDPSGQAFIGIVYSVPDANTYLYASPGGNITGLSGLTTGQTYYAQADGTIGLTGTAKPVMIATSTTTGILLSGSFGTTIPPPDAQMGFLDQQIIPTSTQITANWDRGDGDQVLILISASAITDFPIDNTNYTANANFGDGDEIATGVFVAYKGTGTTETFTGLTNNTPYYLYGIEFNQSGGQTVYSTTLAANNSISVSTLHIGYELLTTESRAYYDLTLIPETEADDADLADGIAAFNDLSPNNFTLTGANTPKVNDLTVGSLTIKSSKIEGTRGLNTGNKGANLFGVNETDRGFTVYALFQTDDGQPAATQHIWGLRDANGVNFTVAYWTIQTNGKVRFNYTPVNASVSLQWESNAAYFADGPSAAVLFELDYDFGGNSITVTADGASVAGTVSVLTIAANDPANWLNDDNVDLYLGTRRNHSSGTESNGTTGSFIRFAVFPTKLTSQDKTHIRDYLMNYLNGTATQPAPTEQAEVSFSTTYSEETEITATGNRGNGSHLLIVAKQGSAVNSDPVDGVDYTAGAFGAGTQIGTGNYVVYEGTSDLSTAITLTGFTRDTNYHLKAYEFNATGFKYLTTSDQFNTTGASGVTTNYIYDDDFANYGTDYTESGSISTSVSGGNLLITGNPGGFLAKTKHDDWTSSLQEFEIEAKLIIAGALTSSTTPGVGLGIENDVSSEANRGVRATLVTNTGSANFGRVQLYSGDGSVSASAYTYRTQSSTFLPAPAEAKEYILLFKRAISGSDALYTYTAREAGGTQEIVSATWTEVNDPLSGFFGTTVRALIWQNGGPNTIDYFIVRRTGAQTTDPPITATHFVSTTGSNTANNCENAGTPCQTVEYVFTQATTPGDVVSFAAGTYTVNAYQAVPAGVSIVGAGKQSTTFKIHSSKYFAINSDLVTRVRNNGQSLFHCKTTGARSTTPTVFRGFTIDGEKPATFNGSTTCLLSGMYIYGRNNITIDDVATIDCGANGIWWENVDNLKVINSKEVECGRGRTSTTPSTTIVGWGSGGWNLTNVRNFEFANDTLIQEYGGVGIKGMKINTWSRANYNAGLLAYVANGSFHDIYSTQNPIGSWTSPSGGYSAAICMELYEIISDSIKWYNNNLDTNVSLVMPQMTEGYSSDPFINATFKTVPRHEFYNNYWYCKRRGTTASNEFALELSVHDVVFGPGNYVESYSKAIIEYADAGSSLENPGHRRQNINIFGNFFEGNAGNSSGIAVIQNFAGWRDVFVYNNTAYLGTTPSGGIMSFYNAAGPGTDTHGVPNWGVHNNVNIVNNIVYDQAGSAGTVQLARVTTGATATNWTVDRNIAYQCNFTQGVTATNSLDSDPLFVGSGAKPVPYFEIQAGSPAVDSGIDVGLSFNGSAPDRGAHER